MIESFLSSHGLYGIAVGALTFLIIGLFHPVVIKAEYYWGTRSWWCFLVLGLACLTLSVFTDSTLWATLLGVVGFTALWSILEVFEQEKRVQKGWFPANPKRATKQAISKNKFTQADETATKQELIHTSRRNRYQARVNSHKQTRQLPSKS